MSLIGEIFGRSSQAGDPGDPDTYAKSVAFSPVSPEALGRRLILTNAIDPAMQQALKEFAGEQEALAGLAAENNSQQQSA